jgi:hypothetical protein
MGTKPKANAKKSVPSPRSKKPAASEEMENIILDMEHDRLGITDQFTLPEEHEMDNYFRRMHRSGRRTSREDDEDNFSYWYGQS